MEIFYSYDIIVNIGNEANNKKYKKGVKKMEKNLIEKISNAVAENFFKDVLIFLKNNDLDKKYEITNKKESIKQMIEDGNFLGGIGDIKYTIYDLEKMLKKIGVDIEKIKFEYAIDYAETGLYPQKQIYQIGTFTYNINDMEDTIEFLKFYGCIIEKQQ